METYTGAEKAKCCLWFHETHSAVQVQRKFRREYHKSAPKRDTIVAWYNRFTETGCVAHRLSGQGRPKMPEETVEAVRESFLRSPRKSTARASLQLGIPKTTVNKILRKRLMFRPYKLQIVQALKPRDLTNRAKFCTDMLERMEREDEFLSQLVFSDEATFHLSGKVNRHNVRIWGSENPHATFEHERDSPKVNVFCAVSCSNVFGPFFFAEKTVTGIVYLDMLQIYLMPILKETMPDGFILQQDGAPCHFHRAVTSYLSAEVPVWIGRGGVIPWPARSPDLSPLDFSVWGFVKDQVYRPPLPNSIPELKSRISTALGLIDLNMLTNIWQELLYRWDICRVTKGSHIEHL